MERQASFRKRHLPTDMLSLQHSTSVLATELTNIFLLLLGLTQCLAVPASQGGIRPDRLFFCSNPGCAANVTDVFCNDKQLLNQSGIADCTGSPLPNTVCQQGGLAFVSTNTDGDCEFEGVNGYIATKKCTDQSNVCSFISATTSSPVTIKDDAKLGAIVGGVCGPVLLLLIGSFWYFYTKRQNSVLDVTVPLTDTNSGETSERNARDVPGLDDEVAVLNLTEL